MLYGLADLIYRIISLSKIRCTVVIYNNTFIYSDVQLYYGESKMLKNILTQQDIEDRLTICAHEEYSMNKVFEIFKGNKLVDEMNLYGNVLEIDFRYDYGSLSIELVRDEDTGSRFFNCYYRPNEISIPFNANVLVLDREIDYECLSIDFCYSLSDSKLYKALTLNLEYEPEYHDDDCEDYEPCIEVDCDEYKSNDFGCRLCAVELACKEEED